MADKFGSIGGVEDAFGYDDADTYSDASPVVGFKAERIQATLAPTIANDVLRLDDSGSIFAPHDSSYVVIALDGTLTTERRLQVGANLTLTDSGANADITIGLDESNFALYGETPVNQASGMTTQLTSITHTAPGTPDYALQALVDSGVGSAWGFATSDEGNTLLSVVLNLQVRVAELEAALDATTGIGVLA